MATAIVVGGGFGGIAAATRLREMLDPPDVVILIDRRADFVMGLRKTWTVVGTRPMSDGTRRLDDLRSRGIDVRRGTVEAIDPGARTVRVDGQTIEGDALVIAVGAQQAPEDVPGLVAHGINVWDRAEAERGHDAVAAFAGGRVLVGVFGVPYSCPPGPYELAFLVGESLAERGVDAAVEVFGPMPIALPVVGPTESAKLEGLLDAAGIPFHRGRRATRVIQGAVEFAEGDPLPFDLLLAVAPHRCPPLLVEAGLAPAGGWVGVDRATLATSFRGVYAVGDCTTIPLPTGLALPKAGVFAEAAGLAAAEAIAADLRQGVTPAAFAGEGVCYAEVGGGRAIEVRGRFLDEPPSAELSDPSVEALTRKVAFESDHLARWFGGR